MSESNHRRAELLAPQNTVVRGAVDGFVRHQRRQLQSMGSHLHSAPSAAGIGYADANRECGERQHRESRRPLAAIDTSFAQRSADALFAAGHHRLAIAPTLATTGRRPVTNAPELDLGSNDELFWLWVRQNEPPAMFVCRHDQFAFSNARQIIPVEPEWLIEALGLVHFDPNEPLEGPFPVHGDRVEIHSKKQSMLGELKKVTVVDLWEGTVVEQDLYTPDTKLLAISRTSHFTHESQSSAALPRSIDIEWPTAQLSFHLDVTDWLVNAIAPNNMSLWTKPEYPGYPNIDLADPHYQFSLPGSAPPVNRMGAPASMPANYPARPAVIPPATISPAPTAAIYPPGATVPVPAAAQAYPPGTSVPLR